MSSAEEVAERLVALFTTLANRVQVALRERGLSLTCKQEVPVLERGDEGAWSLSEQVRHQPVLLALPVSVTIPPLLTEADADEVVTAAADLHAIEGAHLPFYSPLPGGSFLFPRRGSQFDYEADPQTWLVQHVVMPALHHHLALLTSNNTDDVTQAATAFAREAIEVVTSPVLRYRCVVPLAGLTIPDRLTAGKLVVRSLSDEEQGVYAAAQRPVVVRTGFRLPLPFAIGDVPSVMAEIMQDGSRDAHDVDCARGLVSVVVAFALHGYSVSGPGFAGTSSAPPWMMSGHTSSSIMIATRTDKIRTLSQESLQRFT